VASYAHNALVIASNTLRTLEFDKVMAAVSGYAGFSAGRQRIEELLPLTGLAEVETRQEQVAEACQLLDSRPNVTIGGSRDVRDSAKRAAIGSVLRAEELLDIATTLEASRDLKSAINRAEVEIPLIRRWADELATYPEIVHRINETFDSGGEVLDSASPRLRQIRSEIRSAHGRLIERLNGMIASSEYRTSLQEPILTVRNGRYVLPIKTEARSKVPGIVHDQSASGQTSFVEPAAVTELNNKWAELQLEEGREIERILDELSRRVGGQAEGIIATVDSLADLDCAFARARYATVIRATRPILNSDGEVDLVNARHPLLTGDVVPISVQLGQGFNVLVITGPNTGGKTVALKTVGLLTLMAQTGLQIPTDENSRIAIFETVWADIGDEQSIEQSLSTFSSHLTNIISILSGTDDRSLVLLDELGAGTDPAEGSALARSIIRELLDLSARAITTTHYSELKAFAHEQAGVQNASVEFDVESLSPTYRLVIGVPGRSQALAIAKRLGLGSAIIERARSYISQGGLRVERLLTQIQQERQGLHGLFKRAQELNVDLGKLRDRLQEEVARTVSERANVLKSARQEGNQAVRELRLRLSEIEAEANRSGSTAPGGRVRALRAKVDQARAETMAELPSLTEPAKPAVAVAGAIQVGDEVMVAGLGQSGTVTRQVDKEYEVQVGAFKLRRPLADLTRTRAATDASPQVAMRVAERDITVPREIDVRGRRAQEIEPEIERYINDGYMGGMPALRVIHGLGTGALRKAVRDQLEAHPLVAGIGPAPKDQGGDGVTIATLAR
jgi:DNA mismatch repair protein MutS2